MIFLIKSNETGGELKNRQSGIVEKIVFSAERVQPKLAQNYEVSLSFTQYPHAQE